MILSAMSGLASRYALRRRPISGKRYPPASFAKLGLRRTPDMERDVEEGVVLEEVVVIGAKAVATDAMERATKDEVNFMLLL